MVPVGLAWVIRNLENGPVLLEDLLAGIPDSALKQERIPGKWSIHANACHIVEAQPMILKRFDAFLKDPRPAFVPYLPGKGAEEGLHGKDLGREMARFREYRTELIGKIHAAPADFWERRASHPEYSEYSPYIMVRHIMMHDYLHMYRIEELWLTRDGYLGK